MKAQALFEQVTDQVIADIEAGAGDWRMPWHRLAVTGVPENVDGRAYRGMNALWLPLVATAHRWTSGIWATYRGWQNHGAQVRRGEKGTTVVLWKPVERHDNEGADRPHDEGDDHADPDRPRWFARGYTVFCAEQVDGADAIIERRSVRLTERDTPERLDAAEAYFAALGAQVVEGGDMACYSRSADVILLPSLEQFDTAAHYYGTRAHETVHWTGHESRLDRTFGRFGDDAYAVEELVAELGAAMWCAQAGLSPATRQDHAAYLASWLRVLRANPRHLVTVASKAQTAVDWMNNHAHASATLDGSDNAVT